MRASVTCWLKALPLAALAVALPLLLIGPGAHSVPAPAPRCGIAAWTGTCVCSVGREARPESLAALARAMRAAGDTAGLAQASRQCGSAAPPD